MRRKGEMSEGRESGEGRRKRGGGGRGKVEWGRREEKGGGGKENQVQLSYTQTLK